MKAIRKMWAVGCIALLCAACSSATSDEPDDPTANEPVERYFTITTGDSEHSLIYRGGTMLAPSEVSKPLTLLATRPNIISCGLLTGAPSATRSILI